MKVTKEQLRNFYINYHGFNEFFVLSADDAITSVFDRIQSVQFDPLNVCGRNAELVMFSRNKNMTKQALYDSLYKTRFLVDGWDKMMSVFRTSDFARMKFVREEQTRFYTQVMAWRQQGECHSHIDEVYAYVSEHGVTQPADIPSGNTNSGGWGSAKIANVCCEYLWNSGMLCVADKKGVVKSYDLTERLIGIDHNTNAFSDFDEFMRWYVKRRIAAVGALWNKNGGGWLGPYLEKGEGRTSVIDELIERGEIFPVEVEGVKAPFYIPTSAEKYFAPVNSDRAIFVAPLDNLIWDRKLVNEIFGFDYSWEVYVPAAKRKFGYYVLPIIIGNRFIGRFEPSQYKAGEKFAVKNIWYERDYSPSANDIDLIRTELMRLAAFSGVELDDDIKLK